MAKIEYSRDSRGYYYVDRTINGKRCLLRSKDSKKLQRKIDAWIAEQAAKDEGDDPTTVFSIVAMQWWYDAQPKLKTGTWRCYSPCVDRCIDYFGNKLMAAIQPEDIAMFFGKLQHQQLAHNTVSNTKTVLNQIFNFWMFSDQYDSNFKKTNPVPLYRLPRGLSKEERQPPTPQQIEAVKANPQGFGVAAWLFMYTGCRLGEALALQWKDIDFINNTVTVSKSVTFVGNAGKITTTKTKNGVRTIPLLTPLRNILLPLKSLPTDYILSGTDTFLSRNSYQARWAAYCNQIGCATKKEIFDKDGNHVRYTYLPDVTAHQFRHEFASVLYYAGLGELETMRILGHSDISITRNIYQHLRDKQMRDAAEKLNKYLQAQ